MSLYGSLRADLSPSARAAMARMAGPEAWKRPSEGGGEPPPKRQVSLGKQEGKLASEGHASKQETSDKQSLYTRRLQEGANDVPGLMAKTDLQGESLLPYEHQRQVVKRIVRRDCEWLVVAHDAGLGKTATAFQVLSALWLINGGRADKMVVVVPPSTLPQWWETARDWLRRHETLPDGRQAGIKDKEIFMPAAAKKVTKEALEEARVVIISRHLLATLYKSCFEYRRNAEQDAATGRWRSRWVRKEGTLIHHIFCMRFQLMVVDEAHVRARPAARPPGRPAARPPGPPARPARSAPAR
jgi:superfamily II DNA or RNA helicase